MRMNTKHNLRAQKTQNKIRKTLLKKLGTKPIHAITVQEICREARICRTTFYVHYDSLDDLMLSIEVEMQQGINNLFMDADRGTYRAFTRRSLEQLINYIQEHALFYRILLNSLNSLNLLDRDLAAAWKRQIEPVLRRRADTTETELRYRFEYFNSGLRGIIRAWLNANCQESPEELARIISPLLPALA